MYTDWRRMEPGRAGRRCIVQGPSPLGARSGPEGHHAPRNDTGFGPPVASTAMPPAAEARPLLLKMLRDDRRSARSWAAGRQPGRRGRSPPSSRPRSHGRPRRRGSRRAARPRPRPQRRASRSHREPGHFRPIDNRQHPSGRTPRSAPPRIAQRNAALPPGRRGRRPAPVESPRSPRVRTISARSVRWPGRPPTRMSSASRSGRRNTANGCASTASATCSAPRSRRAHRSPHGAGRTCSRRAPTSRTAPRSPPSLRQRRPDLVRLADRPDHQRDRAQRRAARQRSISSRPR